MEQRQLTEAEKGKDINGRLYAKRGEIKAGDVVELDDGFPCMPKGQQTVYTDDSGQLCVKCACDLEEIAEEQGEKFDKNDPKTIATQNHAIAVQLQGHQHGTDVYLGIYPV